MSTVRLAFAQPLEVCRKTWTDPQYATRPIPALVSYAYWTQFASVREGMHLRDIVIDSGAYSAHNAGREIRLEEYIDFCRERMETDPLCTEFYALDVIGDWRASLINCEQMWDAGIPAIPCYHFGEPQDVLFSMAREYPKIALGGAVGLTIGLKNRWAKACFAHIWPKRVHGFGFGAASSAMALPFHSVDSTNWAVGPMCFGRYTSAGKKLPVRGGTVGLTMEVNYYQKLENKARHRWHHEMQLLETLPSERVITEA